MILENSRYFGREIVNGQHQQYKEHGSIVERSKKPFSMIPRAMIQSIDDKENKLFRRNSDKMVIEEQEPTDFKNPQLVQHYVTEIMSHIHHEENKYTIENYLVSERQPEINSKMRGILVDWLVDVHVKFKLRDETLYLTISLIDRYLSKAQVSRMRLQLVGVAALFIACKYEEIYPPALKDFVYITDNAYVKQDVLEMEGMILQELNFNITNPSAYHFLQSLAMGMDTKSRYLAQYILELALVEYKFSFYKPSHLASSSVYLVNKIRKQSTQFIDNELELKPCAKELCALLQNADLSTLQAVRRKFSNQKYLEVSRVKVEKQK